MYNWYTVNTSKLCPTGWHVPSDADWTTLISYLGGLNLAGGNLKETGITHWLLPNTGATNESGFTALPVDTAVDGAFSEAIGQYGFWWSSTETSATNAWDRGLYYDKNAIDRGDGFKKNGISIRCLKD